LPFLLSQIPHALASGEIPVDIAFIQVSPPDAHGYCSLGVSVDVSVAAVTAATLVVAQINRRMPRTHGAGLVHINALDYVYEEDRPLPAHGEPTRTPVQDEIGRLIAEHLVRNGACLQMGIGAIPDAVLARLGNHQNLGIHTEMFSSGLLPLVTSGVVNNSAKVFAPNHVVSSFLVGSQPLYDFVHDNPLVQMLPSDVTNDPRVISANPGATAINSALEVDLTGQVCAESLGHRQHSGVGGQMDFMRGAQVAKNGVAIIALPSTANPRREREREREGEREREREVVGVSRIVSTLRPGAAVTTTRAHVQFVVTEYGIAELRGRTLGERARALIDIAHPAHRERLWEELRQLPL
jgi:acyl-CoA hydrolase